MNTVVKLTAAGAAIIALMTAVMIAIPGAQALVEGMDSGSTSWMLTASLLVFLMIPGVAFFYGGMLRKQSMSSIMAQTLLAIGVMTLSWVILGYSLAFGGSGGIIGNFDFFFFNGLIEDVDFGEGANALGFAMFQMMFAALTAAIVLGACAERVRFTAMAWFLVFWSVFVYVPMAHWVWGGGFESLFEWMGVNFQVLDFAGGDVVHICAGMTGLGIIAVVGSRKESTRKSRAHSIPLAFIGAMMLWVGWFGFNGGSGAWADGTAIRAMFVSQLAAAAAMVAWCICQYLVVGRVGVLGLIAGAIAGLVAITPGAGYVGIPESFVIGLVGGVVCFFAVRFIHSKCSFDDALDVFGVHGVGGIWGGIATGLFAQAKYTGGIDGLFFGSTDLIIGQIIAILITIVFCFVVSYAITFLLSKIMKVRIPEEEEPIGQDLVEHGEPAYMI
ncbi:MAG: ammonium transporter [archaeon]|nr:ammonium transporter [archaeon]